MECRYSKIFEKWIPVRFVENELYLKSIIEELENNLKDKKEY
jgi:hypothetical protein